MSALDSPRIVFMGTPDFAVPSLRALLQAGYGVKAVVTQPDRPKGRKRELVPPPVKLAALEHGIPVLQPEKLRAPEAIAEVLAHKPDLIVTAAYGQILPKAVLDAPRYGCINVHASLLPKYRGGAPIHRAIIEGETVTGVTIMYMAEGLDPGDIISRVEVPITEDDDTGTLHDKLSEAGARLLVDTLPSLLDGTVRAVPQVDAEATYAPNLRREDEWIDWNRTSRQIYNQVRGLRPWPVAYTTWNGEVLKIWEARRPEPSGKTAPQAEGAPGTVVRAGGDGIEVRTGDGTLLLTVVQPAGKRPMPAGDFVRGGRIAPGTVLGGDRP